MEPTHFSFVSLEPRDTFEERRRHSFNLMAQDGATFWRVTVVSDEYPNEPYPHGLYIEGWLERPAEQPPFNFPLTKSGCAADSALQRTQEK